MTASEILSPEVQRLQREIYSRTIEQVIADAEQVAVDELAGCAALLPREHLEGAIKRYAPTVVMSVSPTQAECRSGQCSSVAVSIANSLKPDLYQVRNGDSLAEVARRCSSTTQELAAANGITRHLLIWPGQMLRVPRMLDVDPPMSASLNLSGVARRRAETKLTPHRVDRIFRVAKVLLVLAALALVLAPLARSVGYMLGWFAAMPFGR